MKALFAICMLVAAPVLWAAETATTPPATSTVKGEVLEIKEVESYTYLRLKTKSGETWAAVRKASVKKGAEVTVENAITMNNFESKSLHQTFPTILFGSLAGASGKPGIAGHEQHEQAHAVPAKATDSADIHVAKASGPNAKTVAEITTKAAELKDKPVLVRGKVVKYTPDVMGKNWVHLQDGSGSSSDKSNDILVTTTSQTKNGDVVTVKGTVRTDKDFGAGYSYKVLIEEATLQP